MNWLLTLLITSVTSFVATNLDDIIMLMLFFLRVNSNFRPRQIIFGQYLGFTLIILASSLGLLFKMIVAREWIGLLGFVPLFIGIKQLRDREANLENIQTVTIDLTVEEKRHGWRSLFFRIPPPIYRVAVVTVANGGDNIGIYVALFANNPPIHSFIMVGIFYLMVGIWCAFSYFFTSHPQVAKLLTNYGHKITPWVYIALSIYLLVESQAYRLLLTF